MGNAKRKTATSVSISKNSTHTGNQEAVTQLHKHLSNDNATFNNDGTTPNKS